MAVAKIHGAEFPIRKIFSNEFYFKIPLYQRPYSWTTEQAGELFDDLISFIGAGSTSTVDELSPYFLGSIVLIKEEGQPDAEVVDGQQRLTTLTILISALRHSITMPKLASGMTDYPEDCSMSQSRRHFTPEQKAQIVRRYLADKVPVSQLAEEFSIQPSQIHNWGNAVLTQASKAFERSEGQPRREHAALTAKVERREAKLAQKNEVIAELLEENVKAKKEAGEL